MKVLQGSDDNDSYDDDDASYVNDGYDCYDDVVFDGYVLLHVCTYCTGRRREGLMKFIKFLQDVISGIYIDSQDDHI